MKTTTREKFMGVLDGYVTSVVIIYFSFTLAFISSKLLRLPASNPYNISNTYLISDFNPEINFYRIIWIIIVGVGIFFLFSRLARIKPTLFRFLIATIIAGGIFGAAIMPKVNGYIGHIDTFHHGEQLSPGEAYARGKHLYTDLYVLHGAGEDVLIPFAAMNLPGTPKDGGIGSYFFLTTTLQVISVFLFILFLARYLRSTGLFLIASSWFVFSAYSNFYYARDIPVWLVLILIWNLFHKNIAFRSRQLLLFSVGLIASGSLFFSIDRGYIAMLIVGLCAIILMFTELTGENRLRKLRWPWKFGLLFEPFLIGLGVLAAQLLALAFIGNNSYVEFLKTTFSTIPKTQGLMFNYPLPNLNDSTYALWLPVLMGLIGVLMFIYLVSTEYRQKQFSPELLIVGVLLITSIVFLRAGYGRSDWGHIAYSTPLLFATVFLMSYLVYKKSINTDVSKLWMPGLITVLLLFPVSTVTAASLASFPSISPRALIDYVKLPAQQDARWLSPDVSSVAEYIKTNSASTDSIFVFTQQPIYYYLTKRTNPSPFYISWFADPQQLTTELLNDLNRNRPKIIVYSCGCGWDNPDGYFMKERTPEVDNWIQANYHTVVKIGPVTLLKP